jgi:hypothetical protein
MAMELDWVVPFGRTLGEYRSMFALADGNLQHQILDLGAEPASFTAEMSALSYRATTLDPIDRHFSGAEIQQRFNDCVGWIAHISSLSSTSDNTGVIKR